MSIEPVLCSSNYFNKLTKLNSTRNVLPVSSSHNRNLRCILLIFFSFFVVNLDSQVNVSNLYYKSGDFFACGCGRVSLTRHRMFTERVVCLL